jgi:alcohol dehydrogenase (cytochrome c)
MVLAGVAPAAHSQGHGAGQAIDWPHYNNSYDGQRFSPLKQIDPGNVARLATVCELKVGEDGPFQAGPLVVGDTLYVTTSHTTVAMDAAHCAVRWRNVDAKGLQDPLSVDRGAAYLSGKLFRGMPGAHLAALDAITGKTLWDVKVGDPSVGEFLSAAPVAWNDLVFIGLAGSDWGVRGRMMAFDAATGKEVWRFNTIPMGAEKGAETWRTPGSAVHGGGGTWTTYTLDARAGELFVPVGNPGPDFNPSVREGDNLFTNSVVVLDAKSGHLKWWYQAAPADGYDYDIGAAPLLYAPGGLGRVAIGSKDGHLYSVDRTSHKLLFRTPVTTIETPSGPPTAQGVHACPGTLGGVEWNGPAVDPTSSTLYVGAVDWCATFKSGDEVVHKPGEVYMGTGYTGDPSEKATGWVTAIDGVSGAVKWKYNTPRPVTAGITPTASGLLFTGDLAGDFYAFDRQSGKVLLQRDMGGALAGGVITYMLAGRQYVAFTAGNVSRAVWGTAGTPKVVVMALDAPPASIVNAALPPVDANGLVNSSGAAAGRQQFGQFCAACHGATGGGGGGGPSLLAVKDSATVATIIKTPLSRMPKLYPEPLHDADVTAIADYVASLRSNR